MQVTVENNLVNINPVIFIIENHAVKYKKVIEYTNMEEIRSMLTE